MDILDFLMLGTTGIYVGCRVIAMVADHAKPPVVHKTNVPPRPMPAPKPPEVQKPAWKCQGCGAPCTTPLCLYCKSPQ